MTRTVPSPLQSHLDGATTSTATLWTITRRDGAVLRFTDHDRDIVFGGDSYVASVGYQRSDISGSATMAVDSLDLQGILNSAHISETDLRGGRYNYAALRISLVNWADPDGGGETSLAAGWLGEVMFDETSGSFTAEFRSLFQAFSQNIIEQYGRTCRYDYGDSRCNRDNRAPVFPAAIADNTAYAVGDVVRVAKVGAASPPVTGDYGDTIYRVTAAGTTGAGLVNNFPTVLRETATPATVLDVADANTFSRSAGSFLDDGWQVDMVLRASGLATAANNGAHRVAAVSATTLNVAVSSLVAESGSGDEALVHIARNKGVEFSLEPALRVAGEVLEVVSANTIVVGPPGGPGGGLLRTPVSLVNPGFETGDLSGWTVTVPGVNPGNVVVASPVRTGAYACEISRGWINPGGDTEMTQTVDVVDYAAEIDAGGQTLTATWWHRGAGGAAGRTAVDFDYLDDAAAVISTTEGAEHQVISGVYQQHSQQGAIPANTRAVVITLWGGGGSGDHFVDDFSLTSTLADTAFLDDRFNYGVLTFDSGLNAGLAMEVVDYDSASKTFTLYLSMPYTIAVGDRVGVQVGCGGELSDCAVRDNVINHGGFPTIPGDDEFMRYPDSPY